jgi:TraB/PrgY/gumN family
LWKVERSGLRLSYVFAMDLIPDHAALARMSASMFISDGPDLKTLVGEEYFDGLAALVNKYGIAPGVLLKLKPWVVFSALTMPKPEDGVFLDDILYGAALSGGKNVHGRERRMNRCRSSRYPPGRSSGHPQGCCRPLFHAFPPA